MDENNLVETFEQDGKVLKIYVDTDPINPRSEDNLGIMICWHKRYDLGDSHEFKDPNDFGRYAAENHNEIPVVLSLFLYDHSGLTMNTTGFAHIDSQAWDWGPVGYIYTTESQIKKFGIELPEDLQEKREKLKEMLRQEVSTYSQYLAGDIYGYVTYTLKHCKECGCELHEDEESCWGYYGTDWNKNGLFANAGWEIKEEAKV